MELASLQIKNLNLFLIILSIKHSKDSLCLIGFAYNIFDLCYCIDNRVYKDDSIAWPFASTREPMTKQVKFLKFQIMVSSQDIF